MTAQQQRSDKGNQRNQRIARNPTRICGRVRTCVRVMWLYDISFVILCYSFVTPLLIRLSAFVIVKWEVSEYHIAFIFAADNSEIK